MIKDLLITLGIVFFEGMVAFIDYKLTSKKMLFVVVTVINIIMILGFLQGLLGKFIIKEKYFDIFGTFAYLSVLIVLSVQAKKLHKTLILSMSLVCIWTCRLGIFLLVRILKFNSDSRFSKIRNDNYKLLMAWITQGLWVFMTLLSLLLNVNGEKLKFFEQILCIFGICFWIVGFLFESVADYQKFVFKLKETKTTKFINTGLWSLSRHPNYFGEILMWISISLILFRLKRESLTLLISPLFVYILLCYGTGIPLLEQKAYSKFGENTDYKEYKNKTPVLVPFTK